MTTYYWNDWYFAWGWVLWVGFFLLMISSISSWGYTYNTTRTYRNGKSALELLKERYAKGDVNEDEYNKIKSELLTV